MPWLAMEIRCNLYYLMGCERFFRDVLCGYGNKKMEEAYAALAWIDEVRPAGWQAG